MRKRPIYAELSENLVQAIKNGDYAVGSLMPTELEIAAERGVSRATVRSALDRIESMGFVTRQKGVGTRVIAANPRGYNASTASIEELAHFGAATERIIIDQRDIVADEELARRMGCAPGKRWYLVSVMRIEPGSAAPPICWTDNFISPEYAEVARSLPGQRGLIADLIADQYGVIVDEVVQTIRPILLDDKKADALKSVAKSPALEIVRRYQSAGSPIYISVSQHPGDRFSYRMSLRRR
ncbi:GntR family transcriptional regulator [Chelativorans oligotrophicus]|jgi:DNA-binding GntR family transcriptional regulator|uniref:Transcriptional regulator, GntR family n=1 Tax=Chelativorans sp. (strain BNC1) TaxID=266779 RepID=Q11C81_CHESB|nr:GntR family transcriptional regulator [Chelativorans oligotrophicus]